MNRIFLLTCAMFAWLALYGEDSPYGVCAHVSRLPEARQADREFALMKSGGIDWVRTDFDWDGIQKKPGQWDYSHLDLLVQTAREQEIRILPILGYDVKWVVPVYNHLDQWREYVRRTVSRYASELRYWEVWNEANHVNGSSYTRLDADTYCLLLKAASEEIKKIDPELQVVYSGLAGVPVDFLEQTLKSGAAQYIDVINIHPYTVSQQPEQVKALLDPLFALLNKYHVKKPIWVTEFSWPTHSYRHITDNFLEAVLPRLGVDPALTQVAVIRDPELELRNGPEFPPDEFSARYFPRRKEISYKELKGIDPEDVPVLIPVPGEAFPRQYAEDLVEYVRRGGILLLIPNGFPFYYNIARDANGRVTLTPHDSSDILKAFHIDWLVSWRDKVPSGGKVYPAPGVDNECAVPAGARYLSEKNLKEGDRLIPIYLQKNGSFSAPVAGIYQLNSDLKGSIVLSVVENYFRGVSQEVQGKFLPRACLNFLASGIDKVFWYNLVAGEYDPRNPGHHFGIVHRDLTPRDAFTAYQVLTEMAPAGSTRPTLEVNQDLYTCSWTRPDGAKIHAYWTTRGEKQVAIPYEIREARDYLGRKLTGTDSITATGEIIYLVEQ